MAAKQSTRYRVTVGDSVGYRDVCPSEAEQERLAYLAAERGYLLRIEECTTIIDMAAPTGEKVKLSDRTLAEYIPH